MTLQDDGVDMFVTVGKIKGRVSRESVDSLNSPMLL